MIRTTNELKNDCMHISRGFRLSTSLYTCICIYNSIVSVLCKKKLTKDVGPLLSIVKLPSGNRLMTN